MHIRLLYKKVLCVFMSLMIVIFSTQSAYATTSVGGWTATDSLIAGANTTINAVKGAGATGMRSAVAVAPSAVKIGKYLIKGGGAAALLLAVPQLLGEGVEWVLDPANNAIKYKESAGSGSAPVGNVWMGLNWGNTPTPAEIAKWGSPTVDGACSKMAALYKYPNYKVSNVTASSARCANGANPSEYVSLAVFVNPAYDPSAPSADEKYLPIVDVAAKVIANAESGHAPSQEAVKATALEGFAAGEHDAALDAAATEAGTQNPPDTENPPKDGEAVPFDPSSILAALSSISAILAGILSSLTGFVDWWKSQWTTFSTAITDFNTWVRAEPDTASLQPEPVEVTEGTLVDGWQDKANAGYVNLGATQCPSDVLIPISYMGASTNLSISYVPFCHFASIIRYAVILGAWVAALMIISGGRTRE